MIETFEFLLDELLHPSRFPPGPLIDAARYAVLNGGKRLRPQLLIAVGTLHGKPLEPSLAPACVIEMIHAYSLIHDDLPCMDDDDVRRGKPSLHKVYTEGQALLTGNLLLTYAFETLCTAPHLTPHQRLQIIQTISHRVGAWGMIGGQELDIRSETPMTEETLKDLHRRKTGALIQACVECGIIINESPDAPQLKKLGILLGDLYQLLDDLQDPQDLIEGRPTALALWGSEKTKKIAEDLYQQALFLCSPWQDSELVRLLSYWNPSHLV